MNKSSHSQEQCLVTLGPAFCVVMDTFCVPNKEQGTPGRSVEGPEEGSTLITDHFPTDLPSKYGSIGTLELGGTHIWPIATD